jgi:hypothetical protein
MSQTALARLSLRTRDLYSIDSAAERADGVILQRVDHEA